MTTQHDNNTTWQDHMTTQHDNNTTAQEWQHNIYNTWHNTTIMSTITKQRRCSGETRRWLETWTKEHKDACRKGELGKSTIVGMHGTTTTLSCRKRPRWEMDGTACEGGIAHPSKDQCFNRDEGPVLTDHWILTIKAINVKPRLWIRQIYCCAYATLIH